MKNPPAMQEMWVCSLSWEEMQKAKWLSGDALQIAEKRTEAKDKGEKKRYIHLNEELQRIARRDKKAFLSDQCKEIEENNRMGKTRALFKKIISSFSSFFFFKIWVYMFSPS